MSRADILIVDDEPDVLESARQALECHGYRCLTATDNASALAVASEHTPALVVTDVYHPGPDGIELCRELRRRMPSLPLILFTGCLLADFEVEEMPDGVDYLLKPARMDALVRRVAEALAPSAIGEDPVEG